MTRRTARRLECDSLSRFVHEQSAMNAAPPQVATQNDRGGTRRRVAARANFLRTIIAEDNRTDKYGGRVVTRFPPEPNGYLHYRARQVDLPQFRPRRARTAASAICASTTPIRSRKTSSTRTRSPTRSAGSASTGAPHRYHASDYYDALYEFADMVHRGRASRTSTASRADEMRALARHADRSPGTRQPVSRSQRRREPRSVPPHERGRVSRRRARAAPQDRHGEPEHQPARSGDLPDPPRDASPHRRQVVHLSALRLHALHLGRARAHHAFDLHARIPGSPSALRLGDRAARRRRACSSGRCRSSTSSRASTSPTSCCRSASCSSSSRGSHVDGWDDPRMPTLVGARRRGFTPEGFRLFAERIGVSKSDSWIDMSVLEDCMRDDLNARAERRIAVLDPVKLVIDNYPEGDERGLLRAESSAAAGARQARAAAHARAVDRARRLQRAAAQRATSGWRPGAEVRLRYGYIVHCVGADKDAARQRHRRALHVRPRHPQRHARRRRAQGQGQHPLAVGRARACRPKCGSTIGCSPCRFPARAIRGATRGDDAEAVAPAHATVVAGDDDDAARRPAERNYLDDLNPRRQARDHAPTSSRRWRRRARGCAFQFERHGYFVADLRRSRAGPAGVQPRGHAARLLGASRLAAATDAGNRRRLIAVGAVAR